MRPYLESTFGDAGRLHAEGRATRVALETAREQVATFFGARPREVVFTSSGTEAVNTAIAGALARRDGPVVTTAVEHSCVRDAVARCASASTEPSCTSTRARRRATRSSTSRRSAPTCAR